MVNIYVLEKNNIPFYVGKTKCSLNTRLSEHLRHFGRDITISLIDTCDDDKQIWKFWESYWISQFKTWGFKLENKNEGGGGLIYHSEETKQKLRKPKPKSFSDKLKGQIRPHTSIKLKGLKRSEEFKQLISSKAKGRICSIETRIKMSNSRMGKLKGIPKPTKHTLKKCKPILQYDLNNNFIKEWSSIKEAEIFYFNKQNDFIGSCCRGKYKFRCGYIWKFK